MKYSVTVIELDKLEEDPTYNGHIEEREIPDSQVRHCYLCTMCAMTSYPDCVATCHNKSVRESYILQK